MQTAIGKLPHFGISMRNSWHVSIHHIFPCSHPLQGIALSILSRAYRCHINCSTFASLIYALLIMGTLTSPCTHTILCTSLCCTTATESMSMQFPSVAASVELCWRSSLSTSPTRCDSAAVAAAATKWRWFYRVVALYCKLINVSVFLSRSLSVCRIRLARLSVWIFRTCFVWFLLFSFSFHSERYLDDHLMCVHLS